MIIELNFFIIYIFCSRYPSVAATSPSMSLSSLKLCSTTLTPLLSTVGGLTALTSYPLSLIHPEQSRACLELGIGTNCIGPGSTLPVSFRYSLTFPNSLSRLLSPSSPKIFSTCLPKLPKCDGGRLVVYMNGLAKFSTKSAKSKMSRGMRDERSNGTRT